MNKTFKEWNRLGFSVLKGAKSNKRNDNNEALFHRSQVIESLFNQEEVDHEDPLEQYFKEVAWGSND